jgi:hypothetical protein
MELQAWRLCLHHILNLNLQDTGIAATNNCTKNLQTSNKSIEPSFTRKCLVACGCSLPASISHHTRSRESSTYACCDPFNSKKHHFYKTMTNPNMPAPPSESDDDLSSDSDFEEVKYPPPPDYLHSSDVNTEAAPMTADADNEPEAPPPLLSIPDPTQTYPSFIEPLTSRPYFSDDYSTRSLSSQETDSAVIDTIERTLFIKVIVFPFYNSNLLFLPIVPGSHEYFHEQDEVTTTCAGKTKSNFKSRIKKWGKEGRNSFKFKLHKMFRSKIDSENSFDKFLKRVPTRVRGFEFIHSSLISPTDILANLTPAIKRQELKACFRTMIFAAMLPIAILIDALTFGFVLTAADFTAFLLSISSAIKASNLTQCIENGTFRFTENKYLTEYDESRYRNLHGIPTDEDIEVTCAKLGLPGMAKTVKKLRERQIKKQRGRPRDYKGRGLIEQNQPLSQSISQGQVKSASAPEEPS